MKGTVKTSTILIGAGKRLAVYRKLEEVPPRLRSKLVKSTAGQNAGTVLIADRRGAQELLRARLKALAERQAEEHGFLAFLREDLRETLLFCLLHWRGLSLAGVLVAALAWWLIARLR
ncbi:MAG: hypothetical protein ACM336_00985 [Acidobacteriota bacterium]